MSEIKRILNLIRYTQIIKDPFPEHSHYESQPKLFKKFMQKPEDISIWKAYMIGYNKAYEEIERGLNESKP